MGTNNDKRKQRKQVFGMLCLMFDQTQAIKTLLEHEDTSAAMIGVDVGVSRRMVSRVIRGERRSKGYRIEKAVSDAIGLLAHEVFEYTKGDA